MEMKDQTTDILQLFSFCFRVLSFIFNFFLELEFFRKNNTRWEVFKDWNIEEDSCCEIFYDIYKNSTLIQLVDEDTSECLKELNFQNQEIHISVVISEILQKWKIFLFKEDRNYILN